jgi:hypothetical protein
MQRPWSYLVNTFTKLLRTLIHAQGTFSLTPCNPQHRAFIHTKSTLSLTVRHQFSYAYKTSKCFLPCVLDRKRETKHAELKKKRHLPVGVQNRWRSTLSGPDWHHLSKDWHTPLQELILPTTTASQAFYTCLNTRAGGNHGPQARHLHFSPNHSKWIGRNELKMTTRPRHDCHLTLFHFATRFSSSPRQMASPDTITDKKGRSIRTTVSWESGKTHHYWVSKLLRYTKVAQPIATGLSGYRKGYSWCIWTKFSHPEGGDSTSPRYVGTNPRPTRCTKKAHRHFTLLKLYTASIQCSVVARGRTDLLQHAVPAHWISVGGKGCVRRATCILQTAILYPSSAKVQNASRVLCTPQLGIHSMADGMGFDSLQGCLIRSWSLLCPQLHSDPPRLQFIK